MTILVPSNLYLAYSSLSFILPISFTAYNHQWLAYSSSLLILITSLLYHTTKSPVHLQIDIAACYYLASTYLWYSYMYNVLYIGLPLTTYTIFIYHYGHSTKSLAWSSNYDESSFWHASIHVAVALSASYGSYVIGPL
jgi:hypothetical protein